ncbi:Vitelline membrane outer layer protein 1 [Folsomia candida]|uniref:Vitelline membrane outer layer protein 1 n=1 Tax=Folsomia candida TaxID=158441 RepID=A0A226DGK0_FOLCA|nr:Vitelline membrane outer layer protein 1 [Folsomia candida]
MNILTILHSFLVLMQLKLSTAFHQHFIPPVENAGGRSKTQPNSLRTIFSPVDGKWIESKRVTSWGTWGQEEFCSKGTYAYGIMVKYEEIGTTDDNTGINGFALLCKEANGFPVHSHPSSRIGPWGEWIECHCPAAPFNYLTGFKLCSLPPQGDSDDVAAFGFDMECSISKVHTCIYKANVFCGNLISCPKEYPRICGIRTQVEATWIIGDDTALNNVKFYCC